MTSPLDAARAVTTLPAQDLDHARRFYASSVPDSDPSKGTDERGAFFFDSEGNLLALGQATR